MFKNNNIKRIFMTGATAALVLMSVSIGFFWITAEFRQFEQQSEELEKTYIESQKKMVKDQVENVINYIHYNRAIYEKNLQDDLKQRVYQAHAIASNIYNQYKDRYPEADLKKMILDALRPARFNNGRSYFIVTDLYGISQLYPPEPSVEGTSLGEWVDADGKYVTKEIIALLKKEGETYRKYFWHRQDENSEKTYPKIGFVKIFKPFNWFIGTGEFLDNVENDIKKEVLERISRISYDENGYVFVNTFDGIALIIDSEKYKAGDNVWELTDPNGVKVVQLERKAAENPEGGFIHYSWVKPSTSQYSPKISFIKAVNDWKWMIGAGVYLDDINSVISAHKHQLKMGVMQHIISILLLFLFVLTLTILLSNYYSEKIKDEFDIFTSFFKEAAHKHKKITEGKLKLNEFKVLAESANYMVGEREKIENELVINKQRMDDLISSVNGFLWSANVDKNKNINHTIYTESIYRITGYKSEEFLNVSKNLWVSIIHPDDSEFVKASINSLLNSQAAHGEYRIIRKDGKIRWLYETAEPLLDENGRTCQINGVCVDITDRIKAEEDLEAEKERLAVTLRSIGDAVITTDTHGNIVMLNKVAEELTGWTQSEAHGKPLNKVFRIIDEKTKKPAENPVKKVMKSGTIVGLASSTLLISKDGTERIIADSGAPIRDKGSKILGIVLVFRDITEHRKLENEVLKNRKLESVGLLAGGIAHDFNNLLTAILGNISLAKLNLKPGERTFDRLEDAEKATMRAKDLTQQLLTFSRGGAPVKKLSDVGILIRETSEFALRGSNVKSKISIPENLWSIEVDEGQLSQVINNLVINADQAMPEGGTLEIIADNLNAKGEKNSLLKKGKYIRLVIRDQGIGIPMNHLDKIFDPYFTTKQHGNGLGLATTHSIIKNHQGYITVKSELGNGTEFIIYLPAISKTKKAGLSGAKKITGGSGNILVMDDDDLILKACANMLKSLGYKVVLAPDGGEAIEKYTLARSSGEPFDLIMMDLTVPGGMGGKETIRKMKEIEPGLKAIVMSGYSNDPVMANYEEYGFMGVITKPFNIEELAATVGRVISDGHEEKKQIND
ncbi:MAG: cache domain-containing protein [Calditrichaceae bacterium]